MDTASRRATGGVPDDSDSEQRLLDRARAGSVSAIDVLFARLTPWLRRRARGRLPAWARSGTSTSDMVQDALHDTYARLNEFEAKHVSALRAYLRRAVDNRIRDELRRATRRLDIERNLAPEETVRASEDATPQYRQLRDDQMWKRYRDGLNALNDRDRRLVAGRAELGYSYEQLSAIEGLPSADAARKALKRALIRLSEVMPKA